MTQLWSQFVSGLTYISITEQRRKNLLKQTNPSFLSLLKKYKNFSDEEFNSLFGDFCLEKNMKTTKDDALLNAVSGRSGGPRSLLVRSFHGGSNRERRDKQSFRNSGFNELQTGYANGGQSNRRGSFRSASESKVCSIALCSSVAIRKFGHPVGGRLRCFAANWTMVSKDPLVWKVVSDGLLIAFFAKAGSIYAIERRHYWRGKDFYL